MARARQPGDGQLDLFSETGTRDEQEAAPGAPAAAARRCKPDVAWTSPARRGDSGSGPLLRYHAYCRTGTCRWTGPEHDRENAAAEDACDHAWPGWRTKPLMPDKPNDHLEIAQWLATARRVYPRGWVDAGGPIRTVRPRGSGQRSYLDLDWDGFNMAVVPGAGSSGAGNAPRAVTSTGTPGPLPYGSQDRPAVPARRPPPPPAGSGPALRRRLLPGTRAQQEDQH